MDPAAAKHLTSCPDVTSRKENREAPQASDALTKAKSSFAPYGSTGNTVSQDEKEKVRALPDLMEKLKAHGIESLYYDYRDRYLEWRRGGHAGTHGELTMEALEGQSDPFKFEFWYPTPGVFRWRFTAAYWIAVLFLQGSFFFTFDAGVMAFHGHGGHIMETWPYVFGSVCYTLASYFIYLQLINIGIDDRDEVQYFCADWNLILKRVGPSSCVGTLGYVIGALLFQIGVIPPLFSNTAEWVDVLFVVVPNFLGAIGFLIGGCCELVHNEMLTFGTTPADTVWWASFLNFSGSVNFVLGAAPPVFAPMWTGESARFFMNFNMFMGSGLFALSSVLLIVMWEGNDFGLTLFYQLNRALQAKAGVKWSSHEDKIGLQITAHKNNADFVEEVFKTPPTRYNVQSTIFLVVYCWFVFVASVDVLCQEIWFKSGHGHEILLWTGIGMQIFIVTVVIIILLIHSVVTHVPHEQPYRAAVMLGRGVMVLGAVCQTIDLTAFLTQFWTAFGTRAPVTSGALFNRLY